MKIQNVKGGYDYLPKEQRLRNYINEVLKNTFEAYGYQPIETPIICYRDMLIDKYDDTNDLLKEIYHLSDQGNRDLGLRYDLTVPFAKLIALNKNEITMPFKRYEIAKVFRDGPVKVGRDREFTQCDCDIVGLDGQFIEAELLNLYVDAFKKLDIDILIKYNNRLLMTGILKSLKIKENISKIITVIDKMNKITRDELVHELNRLNISDAQINELFKIFKMNLSELEIYYKDYEEYDLNKGLEEVKNLTDIIEFLGLSEYCTLDLTLARGQDYYTGNVFEVLDRSGFLTSSIGGGGRYDKMIGEYISDGETYPAVGISFGLTSIYELLRVREMFKEESLIKVFIIPLDTKKESLYLASKLRGLGINTEVELRDKKLKKSLDYANKENIPYVIILGEDEVKNKEVTVKDMKNKNDFKLNLENIEKIKEYIF